MKEEIYDIGGMNCAACSSSIERVTRKLPGVKQSDINLPLNRLTIIYDENICKSEDIIKKVEKAGFTATLHQKMPSEQEPVGKKEDIDKLKGEKTLLMLSLIFAGALLTLSMGHMIWPDINFPKIISPTENPTNFAIIEMLLTIPVLLVGRKFFTNGFKALFHKNPNMDTLVALSSTASFLYSLVMTFLISENPMLIHSLYYESAAVVVALVSVGKYLEESNKEKTKGAIKKLMDLTPDKAILVDKGGQRQVNTSEIKVGDIILAKPGSHIPLDGIIHQGSGSVNEAMLTGESMPVEKEVGMEVIGGSLSIDGALYIEVTKIGEETTLSKIIRFVEDAQGKKAPISKIADKVAGVFVPIVIGIALLSSIMWAIVGMEFSFVLKIFTCVLVIACPCAMGLATPTAIIVGTGLGATNGILIRSGEALETTHNTTVAIFDKTGTVTEGKPKVTEIACTDEAEFFKIAYSLEKMSEHPLAKAICEEVENKKYILDEEVYLNNVRSFENITGRGLKGICADGETAFAGSGMFLEENKIALGDFNEEAEGFRKQGKSIVFIGKGEKCLGFAAISDTIKEDSKKSIDKLKEMGIKTIMLTGDNRSAAQFIGQQLEVEEIIWEVLPTDKANVVKKYQELGEIVMMVGDGINDSPALVQADVGCAIGNGSDIAIDSADIVLMKTGLMEVCRAITLSKITIRNIKQNLFWAFCYNVLGIPIAAGLLYPIFHILLSPMIGAVAMSLSSLFVVTNALRLKGKKI